MSDTDGGRDSEFGPFGSDVSGLWHNPITSNNGRQQQKLRRHPNVLIFYYYYTNNNKYAEKPFENDKITL